MKKFFLLITLLTFSLLLINIPSNAAPSYAIIKNIVSSYGEEMGDIGVNWHCSEDGSYLVYSKNSSLNKTTKVIPESTTFQRDAQGDDYPEFKERYVCKADIKGLDLYTTYYYQIVCGSTRSEVYSFNTGLNSKTTKFAWMSDTQTGVSNYGMVQAVMNRLFINEPDLAFCLITGDVTDRGGQEPQWNGFFGDVKSLNKIPFMTTAGNHEYYTTSSSSYDSPYIYNQYFNNPNNSFTGRINSTYYFKYNNILFIMLDTIKTDMMAEHREWLVNVLENNTSDYIIVGMHCGLTSTGEYMSDAKIQRAAFQDIFENYSVDLVLSGHEHVFSVTSTMYQGKKNPELGTTYVVGAASGNKMYKAQSIHSKDKDFIYDQTNYSCYSGSIIEVDDEKLTLKYYNVKNELVYSFSLPNRRKVTEKFEEQKLLDTMQIVRDAEKETVTLTWNAGTYGHVDNIKVIGKEVNLYNERPIKEVSRVISLANINSLFIGSNYSDTNYYYTVVVTKLDGTQITKDFEFINNPDLLVKKYDVVFKDENGNVLKTETVKEGESATAPNAPTKDGYNFVGWDKDFTNVTGNLEIKPLYEAIVIEDNDKDQESGCKKDLIYLVSSCIALTSLAFVTLRKKNN